MVLDVRTVSAGALFRPNVRTASAKSDGQDAVHDGGRVLFFFHNMVIDVQYHLLRVAHQLGNLLYADFWHFIAEVRAVIVPEDMGGKACDGREGIRPASGAVHLALNGSPHLHIG